MTGLLRAVVAFLAVKLVVLTTNVVRFPVLGAARPAGTGGGRPPSARPTVSLLVPMRNEAHRLRAHLPGILDQDVVETIVLDDGSEDASLPLARSMLAGHPGATVVEGTTAPPGWVGKNWACHQLAGLASGSVLVFCDADVSLAPGAVARVVDEMLDQRADVFSVFPRQLTGSLGERVITPLVDDVLLTLLPFALLSIDVPRAATANGSVLAFTRAAHDRLGGFAAVRGEIVEDVALARLARRTGLRLGLALGGEGIGTRMYTDYRGVVAGFGRGLLPVLGGSKALLVTGLVWHVVAYTLPWALARRHRAWLVPVALALVERAAVDVKTRRCSAWQAPLIALSPLAAIPVVLQALRPRQTWKGRPCS